MSIVSSKTHAKKYEIKSNQFPHMFYHNLWHKQTKTNSKDREGGHTVGSGRVAAIIE